MGRYDTLLEEPKKVTPPEETKPPVKKDIEQQSQPAKKIESKKAGLAPAPRTLEH